MKQINLLSRICLTQFNAIRSQAEITYCRKRLTSRQVYVTIADFRKMATVMMHVFRAGRALIKNVCPRTLSAREQNYLKPINARFLFSEQALALDKYEEQRRLVSGQFTGLKEKFFLRMREYVNEGRQSMIFTEDLKNIVFLAEDKPEDIELCILLMKKFHKQNKELRFGTFIFGPVFMRWIHVINKPDLVLQLLNSEDLAGFFDQITSYHIAMDLLFKCQMYKEVLDCFNELQEKPFFGTTNPRDPVVLALGACYYLNTPESHQKSLEIIQERREKGDFVVRRGLIFAAKLALQQGNAEIAMEILSLAASSNYFVVRNLRLQMLAELNRLEDIFPILRQVIDRDLPSATPKFGTICQETLDLIQKKLDDSKDKEMLHIFEQICRALKENKHITTDTIDHLISLPIHVKQMNKQREGSFGYTHGSTSRPGRSYDSYGGYSNRGGQSRNQQIKDEEHF